MSIYTGIAYHEAMLLHKGPKYHPERPERVKVIFEALKDLIYVEGGSEGEEKKERGKGGERALELSSSESPSSSFLPYIAGGETTEVGREKNGETKQEKEKEVEKGERVTGKVKLIVPGKILMEDLLLVHEPRYLECIISGIPQYFKKNPKASLLHLSMNDNCMVTDTFACRESPDAALYAAGGVLELAARVQGNENSPLLQQFEPGPKLRNGFALVRPPGHHVCGHRAMGYCIFNNIAVAGRALLEKGGVSRLMIFDWDVHFGNGICDQFSGDPRVLCVSIHRWQKGKFFPGGERSEPTYPGEGPAGRGFHVNIGWIETGMGDLEYDFAMKKVVLPIAQEFDPEFILVAAGFGAADGDGYGEMKVTPKGYASITKQLMSLTNGKIVMALEGGYNLESNAKCARAVVEQLLSLEPISPFQPPRRHPLTEDVIKEIRKELTGFDFHPYEEEEETPDQYSTPSEKIGEETVPKNGIESQEERERKVVEMTEKCTGDQITSDLGEIPSDDEDCESGSSQDSQEEEELHDFDEKGIPALSGVFDVVRTLESHAPYWTSAAISLEEVLEFRQKHYPRFRSTTSPQKKRIRTVKKNVW